MPWLFFRRSLANLTRHRYRMIVGFLPGSLAR